MAAEDIYSWSRTAASNATADTGINWAEGQPRNSVNNSARSMMAAVAKQFALQTGAIVTAGTANAQTFTSGVSYTAMPVNFFCRLKVGPGLTNTGPPALLSLSMDGMSSALVNTANGQNVPAGTFTSGGYVELLWRGDGVWVCLHSTKFAVPDA